MSDICCLLDACTAINLIHIDEDDFVQKKLNLLDVNINETVFYEINSNVYEWLDKNIEGKYADKVSLEKRRKEIELKLTYFRGKKNTNSDMLDLLGEDYFDRIKELTRYTKRFNGELCSAAHALYLSRINEKKVFFYTDDYPAKDFFSPFFDYQQIGQIKDSVDLLLLIYWLDNKFSERQLEALLSELHSYLAAEVVMLKHDLRAYREANMNAVFVKSKKEIAQQLSSLTLALDKLDLTKLNQYWLYFEGQPKAQDIFKILKKYLSVFGLGGKKNESSILDKLTHVRKVLKEDKILKLNDLTQ